MNLPTELQPTGETVVPLPSGTVARLPTCFPIFSKWFGASDFNYGSKPIIDYDGNPLFPELVLLELLRTKNWEGIWVETFGGVHYLRKMPDKWALKHFHEPISEDKDVFLKSIFEKARGKGCFDVFAWNKNNQIFYEAKHRGKDRLTGAQLKFLDAALASGIPEASLIIAEWKFDFE